jgi:acetylornithine deacetylase
MELNSAFEITNKENLLEDAIQLLKELIRLPSFSKDEKKTGDLIEHFFVSKGITVFRKLNNIWAFNQSFNPNLPTILLNSHHDTVKPNPGYTRDPFVAEIQDGRLFGLGSNDAGGSLVSLIAAFLHFHKNKNMAFNLAIAATGEEEISGSDGLESILAELGPISFALVGEPTLMQLAVAEKGLMVIDCVAHGKAGHAAREEGENAIYKAIEDINWMRNFRFPKVSTWLGPVKLSVTMINAGTQHNVVPELCQFTADIRLNELYTHDEIIQVIRDHIKSEIKPRSTRLAPSFIPKDHPIVQAGIKLGRTCYGSPTTSDQALIAAPSLKLGPGDSARSHTADEFIYVNEIREGIDIYIRMLQQVLEHHAAPNTTEL